MSLSWLTSSNAYKSPAFIALVSALCVAVVLLLHQCVLVNCCHGGAAAADRDRRRRRQHHHQRHVVGVVTTTTSTDARRRQQDGNDDDDDNVSVEVSATSRTHLVAAAVVCRYRKEEAWKETTCPVCLADFDDGEAVRVLPECMHYFHAECIDTWLRGSTSCPMCRAETTPTPSPTPTPSSASVRHHLELSVSLEEILVRS